jgi:hypothetical protein
MANSNPSLPPYDPPEPEYPYQYLAADYFHYGNKDYCVLVDRYSHWPFVLMAEQGAKGSAKHLRRIFSPFGISQEIATRAEFVSRNYEDFRSRRWIYI